MCLHVFNLNTVMKLGQAAQHVQKLIDDGTLAAAFGANKFNETHECVTAFDLLGKAAGAVGEEVKAVSPFLRYRKEIMGSGTESALLRGLVMSLWGTEFCTLHLLFKGCDPHHTKIALDCIASYTNNGDNDPHFKNLASEIVDYQSEEAA